MDGDVALLDARDRGFASKSLTPAKIEIEVFLIHTYP